MPAARQRSRSPAIACAVIATMRRGARRWRARDSRMPPVASKPPISGIWTSIRTRSKSLAERRVDRLASVVDDGDHVAALGEQARGHVLVDDVVLGQEDRGARRTGRRRAGPPPPISAASRSRSAPRRRPIIGSVKWNVLPAPDSLSTQIRPPIICTSVAEIVRPRPVPPNRRVVEPSAWLNASKMVACLSRGMPMPVSVTREVQHRGRSPVPALVLARARRSTSPRSVNLMALPTRLTRTCRSRTGSPTTPRRHVRRRSSHEQLEPLLAPRARPAASRLSSTTSRSANGTDSSSSLRASIFEKSRMSLRIVSSDVGRRLAPSSR